MNPDSIKECDRGTSLTKIPSDTMSSTTMVPLMSTADLDCETFTSSVYTDFKKKKNNIEKMSLNTSSMDETILDTLRAAWEERARSCSRETSICSSPSNTSMMSCSTVIIGEIDQHHMCHTCATSTHVPALENKSDAVDPLSSYSQTPNLSYVDDSENDNQYTLLNKKRNIYPIIENNKLTNRTTSSINVKPEPINNRQSGNARFGSNIQSSHFHLPNQYASAVSITSKHGLRPARPKRKSISKWLNKSRSQSHSSLLSRSSSGLSSSSDEKEEQTIKVNSHFMSDKVNNSPTQQQNNNGLRDVISSSQYEKTYLKSPSIKSCSSYKSPENYYNQTITDPLTKQTFSRPFIKPDPSRRYDFSNYQQCSRSSLRMANQHDSRSTISSLNSHTCSKQNNVFKEVDSKYHSKSENMTGIVNRTDDVYQRRTVTENQSISRIPIDLQDSERNVTSTDSFMSKSKRYKYSPKQHGNSYEQIPTKTCVSTGVQTELLDKNWSKITVNQNGTACRFHKYESSYRMQDPESKASRKPGVLIVRHADKCIQVNDAMVQIIYEQPKLYGDENFNDGTNEKEVQTMESVDNLRAESRAKKMKEQKKNILIANILRPLNFNAVSQHWMDTIDMLKSIWKDVACMCKYALRILHPIMPLFWICVGIGCTVAIYHFSKPKHEESSNFRLIRKIKEFFFYS